MNKGCECESCSINFISDSTVQDGSRYSLQHFPRLWWLIITTLYKLMLYPVFYKLMLQSWYQKTAQSLVIKTLLSFLWQNRLTIAQYNLLKTPTSLALTANTSNSKTSSVTLNFCYLIGSCLLTVSTFYCLKWYPFGTQTINAWWTLDWP